MTVKQFKIIVLASIFSLGLKAQYSEIGLFGGGSHFIGDVGHYGLHLPKGFGAGVLYRYVFNEHYSLRASLNYGIIRNEDSSSTFDARVERNLHFESRILEASLLLEFNFFDFRPGSKKNHTPYLMGGFGIFNFNPRARYAGQWYDLQPLGTEGQQTSLSNQGFYPRASSFFVFGAGYKWALNRSTSIGIESTFRRTRTDYLDDVSGFYADPEVIREARGDIAAALSDRSLNQSDKTDIMRGNPANDDWYIFTGITLTVKFGEVYEKCANFLR